MKVVWQMIAGVLVVLMLSLWEVYIDKKLKKVYQKFIQQWRLQDNLMDKYKMYNKAAHELQTPWRGVILLMFSVIAVGYDPADSWWCILKIVNYFIYIAAVYWIIFDILANKLWLGVEWHYIGSTAKTDTKFKSKVAHFAAKIALLLFGGVSFVLYCT